MRILILLLILISSIAKAEPKLFENPNMPNQYLFYGEIQEGDARQLVQLPMNSKLFLNSMGGDYIEGVTMGYILKAKNITVEVYPGGECLSACAYAAIYAKDMFGQFGFHAPYTETGKIEEFMDEFIRTHLKESEYFSKEEIEKILATGPDDMIYWTFGDPKDFKEDN